MKISFTECGQSRIVELNEQDPLFTIRLGLAQLEFYRDARRAAGRGVTDEMFSDISAYKVMLAAPELAERYLEEKHVNGKTYLMPRNFIYGEMRES